jgi:uncharacterized protein (DUF2141 family)
MRPALPVLLALAAAPLAAPAAELNVTVTGAVSAEGEVRVHAWSEGSEAAFSGMAEPDAAAGAPADPAGVTLALSGLPEAPVALIAWHDEDGDGALDRFLGMWPTEPWAVSNDPEISGPPEFGAAALAPASWAEGVTLELSE